MAPSRFSPDSQRIDRSSHSAESGEDTGSSFIRTLRQRRLLKKVRIKDSFENGKATAHLELACGYPGYFYTPGNGDYICAVDEEFGLPIRLGGDCDPDLEWIAGFNIGTETAN